MKKLKCLAVLLAAMMASYGANAEELKKSVLGVENFTYASSFSEAEVEMIRNQIINAIQKTGRVIVVDRATSVRDAESEHRKQESAMDANKVADMISLNATSLLTANLDQITVKQEIYEDKKTEKVGDKYQTTVLGRYPYYKASISYTIKITDCEKGTVQGQQTYTKSAGIFKVTSHSPEYADEKSAHDGILTRCVDKDEIAVLILNTFKAQGKVLQVETGDAKKAKTVFVNLGSEDGIEVKQVLEVYKEVDVAGEKSKVLVGEIEVAQVIGASRCIAKVKSGGDVMQQILSAGGNLPVQTRNVKAKLFGGVK